MPQGEKDFLGGGDKMVALAMFQQGEREQLYRAKGIKFCLGEQFPTRRKGLN